MGLSTFLAPVSPSDPSLLALRQAAVRSAAEDDDDELDMDEWEASPAGQAFTWFIEHPERVDLGRHAPVVACALGESSSEVWIWSAGGERIDPDTLLTYLDPDATRRAAEVVGPQSAREWNANVDEAIERRASEYEAQGELRRWGNSSTAVRTGAEMAAYLRKQDAADRATVLEIASGVQVAIRSAADRGWGILSVANL